MGSKSGLRENQAAPQTAGSPVAMSNVYHIPAGRPSAPPLQQNSWDSTLGLMALSLGSMEKLCSTTEVTLGQL